MRNIKKIIKIIAILFILSLLISIIYSMFVPHIYRAGYVNKEETAINIAVAVWTPIYGKEQIEKEKPYKATLKDGIWYVSGSLQKGWVGGVAEAEIAKDDGRIIRISHGK